MTREEFIKVLDEKKYSYKIEGDKIVVTHEFAVFLGSLTSLPPGVVFSNRNDVFLDSLTSLPPGVKFNNVGNVYLGSLTSIPREVVFKNVANVYLEYLTGGWIKYWRGNIEGIDPKRLLNKMISLGLFER
jgi:hypothetical protein